MKLTVFVLGRAVATFESLGDFRSVLSYLPGVDPNDFVSLTMPVRTESYLWDDSLHPIFQMNLPEGYLLQMLQEQFGPHLGASPTALLSVVGRNMVGRIQVTAPGAPLDALPRAVDVAGLLAGDNSEQAFSELVRQNSASGVSGVVPKFLDSSTLPMKKGRHSKATLLTRLHIIKGSSSRLPFVALNEHLCMKVAARVMPTARTEVSDDGQALVVHRFDVDERGQPFRGFEDFCVLLGLRPAAKYETTWERIAKAVRDHVPGSRRLEAFRQLTVTLLLTYALRNSDCHAKNVALLYTSRGDVGLSPVYDMVSTGVYAGFQHNPPGIGFLGKKTWTPGRDIQRFVATCFGVPVREQVQIVEAISDAVSDTAPLVRAAMRQHTKFRDVGKRMLIEWNEGVSGLRHHRTYAAGPWLSGDAFRGFSAPPKLASPAASVGRSELLARRRRKPKRSGET